MSSFTSKFNLNDTAYVVNKDTLSLESVVITDIRIRQSVELLSGPASYIVSYRGRTSKAPMDFSEAELYFLDEGKELLESLVSNKISTLRGLN